MGTIDVQKWLITEVFDFGRFSSVRDFMSYLGLTPSESSSGEKEHKGPITKTGNKRARRLLTEAAWHHRYAYGVSNVLRKRREGQPPWAIGFVNVVLIEQSERLSNIALRLLEVFPGF